MIPPSDLPFMATFIYRQWPRGECSADFAGSSICMCYHNVLPSNSDDLQNVCDQECDLCFNVHNCNLKTNDPLMRCILREAKVPSSYQIIPICPSGQTCIQVFRPVYRFPEEHFNRMNGIFTTAVAVAMFVQYPICVWMFSSDDNFLVVWNVWCICPHNPFKKWLNPCSMMDFYRQTGL